MEIGIIVIIKMYILYRQLYYDTIESKIDLYMFLSLNVQMEYWEVNNKSLVGFKIENTCITDTDLMWFDYYVITQRNSQTLVSTSSFGKD